MLKSTLPAEAVGQAAFLHDLQQHVEDVRVGLLDFVEQHHRVRPAADALGELAAFLVADVARRGADQPADVVLLHVLGHVDLDQGVFVAEHELGQGLGQQRLADAGGAQEDEAAHRPVRVLQAAAAAADGLGDRLDRLVLADDALVQLVLQLQQPLGLLLLQAGQRHAGHLADDLGDDFLVDHAVDFLVLLVPLLLHLRPSSSSSCSAWSRSSAARS